MHILKTYTKPHVKVCNMLILFEGVNAAGKTTLIDYLLPQVPTSVKVSALPTESWLAKVNSKKYTSFGMFISLIICRHTYTRKLLKTHPVVFQDRGFISEATHLPNSRRVDVKIMASFLQKFYPKPNLLILVDIDPEVAARRARNREENGGKPVHANAELEFLTVRRELFLEKFKTSNGAKMCLCGTDPVEVNAGIIMEAVDYAS